jgi:hypothetical protein
MKQKNILSICTTAIILFFAQCTKPLKITVPQAAPKLCISSQVVPSSTILVSITKSFTSLYDNTKDTTGFGLDIFVAHALVTIKYNGKTDTLTKLADGVYIATNVDLTVSNLYELEVYDSTLQQTVTATTTMQPAANVDSISKVTFFEKNAVTGKIDTTLGLSFSLNDNAASGDYYYLSFTKTSANTATIPLPGPLANTLNQSSIFYLYTDQDAKAGKVTGTILQSIEFPFAKTDTLLATVSRIDKAYFTYLSALKRKGNLLNQITGEPINVIGNIKNGYGYFSAIIPAIRIIDLSK